MESNLLTAVFLPLSLFCIMLGMGLALTLGDFKRIGREPKRVLLGLAAQLILLPALACIIHEDSQKGKKWSTQLPSG